MKVLLAEDDDLQAAALRALLERWGYSTLRARDGPEAWRLFEATADIALVLSDWMMPGLDGPELVRRIRSAGRPGYVYVILLSAPGPGATTTTSCRWPTAGWCCWWPTPATKADPRRPWWP
jgi:CheY-like chemotaxis protein